MPGLDFLKTADQESKKILRRYQPLPWPQILDRKISIPKTLNTCDIQQRRRKLVAPNFKVSSKRASLEIVWVYLQRKITYPAIQLWCLLYTTTTVLTGYPHWCNHHINAGGKTTLFVSIFEIHFFSLKSVNFTRVSLFLI